MGELRQRLDEALEHTVTSKSDAGTVALVRAYADAIDEGGPEQLKELGSKLLTALDALGMTPLARMTMKRGTSGGPVGGESELDKRRRERDLRKSRAADLHAAAGGADT